MMAQDQYTKKYEALKAGRHLDGWRTRQDSGFLYFEEAGYVEQKRSSLPKVGLKLHANVLSMPVNNLKKAWGVLQEILVQYRVPSSKVINVDISRRETGKEITIYLAPAFALISGFNLEEFIRECEAAFQQGGIRKLDTMKFDRFERPIRGSNYFSFRRDGVTLQKNNKNIGIYEEWRTQTCAVLGDRAVIKHADRGDVVDFYFSEQALEYIKEHFCDTEEKRLAYDALCECLRENLDMLEAVDLSEASVGASSSSVARSQRDREDASSAASSSSVARSQRDREAPSRGGGASGSVASSSAAAAGSSRNALDDLPINWEYRKP